MIMGQLSGIAGAVVGGLIGLLGAAGAGYFSTKNTKGPREKAFMVRAAIWYGGVLIVFLALLLGLPYGGHLQRIPLLIPYTVFIVVFLGVRNRRQARIREEEAQELAQERTVAQPDAAQDGESAAAPSPPGS